MKFELTTESIMHCGHKLFRLKALISFGDVKAGDLGGYVEKKQNFSESAQVSGDAWVWGNARVWGDAQVSDSARVWGDARVSGNARVSGDALVSKSPILISGLLWSVTITDFHIQIGCEIHTIKEWGKFKDIRIEKMSTQAVVFWQSYKPIIMDLAIKHEVKKKDK